eukprot:TRINITY_DN6174_c0_g1_i1.p1 TRINITY_DN6174_c0_g1~~TRINITY_DN6174_c0_g1_i1.p1  ORF type:complete len:559 (+),score=81.42 TRINITY_DN6174_c0_g1_i1:688-2364(+)
MNSRKLESFQKELEECTFAPVVRSKATSRYLSTARASPSSMRQVEISLSDSVEFIPKVDKNSARLARSRRSKEESIYERLFNTSRYTQESAFESSNQQNLTFQPQINEESRRLSRHSSIDTLLFNDAKRRAASLSKRQELKQKERLNTTLESAMSNTGNELGIQTHVLSKSSCYLAEKFTQEFNKQVTQILQNVDTSISSTELKFSYLKSAELLTAMKFLSKPSDDKQSLELTTTLTKIPTTILSSFNNPSQNDPGSREGVLLFDMWQLLKGEDFGGISPRSLKAFLLSVLGLHMPWMEHGEQNWFPAKHSRSKFARKENWTDLPQGVSIIPEGDETDHDDSPLRLRKNIKNAGHFPANSQDFCVSKEDVLCIHSHFRQFCENRQQVFFSSISQPSAPQYSFCPTLCQSSRLMAKQSRSKAINSMAITIDKPLFINEVSHSDLMHFKHQEQQNKKEKNAFVHQQEEDQKCTFHPEISKAIPSTKKSLQQLAKFWKPTASSSNKVNIRTTKKEQGEQNKSSTAINRKKPLHDENNPKSCLLYTSPSPRDLSTSRMPSSA